MDMGGSLSGSVFPVHGQMITQGKRNCKRFFAFFASLCKLYIDLQEGIKPFVQIAQMGRCCLCGEAVSEKSHTQGAGSFQDVNCLIFHNPLCLDKKFSKSNFQFALSVVVSLFLNSHPLSPFHASIQVSSHPVSNTSLFNTLKFKYICQTSFFFIIT